MVTTRTGRAMDATKPHTMQRKKKRQPANRRWPIGVARSPPPPNATGPSPLGELPVEILWLIARALPSHEPYSGSSHPRPSDLFPLAITCKGFWESLRPLLFQLDVNFTTMEFKPAEIAAPLWRIDPGSSDPTGSRGSMSALVFGILSGHTSTAEFAIQVAQSQGKLRMYTSVYSSHKLKKFLPVRASWWRKNRWNLLAHRPGYRVVEMDPLSLAIVNGNTKVVDILTRGADASVLSRVGPQGYATLRHSILLPMTPLHLAILMDQDEIAKILLQRFAEVDQATLEWTQPEGLGLASFLRSIKMVRLLLDGDEEDGTVSPWVERVRSQLRELRAYDYDLEDRTISTKPPMILASVGWGHGCLSAARGGNTIFALLADKNPHLVTRKYGSPGMWSLRYESPTPLGIALRRANLDKTFRGPSILALIRVGALEPSLLPPPTTGRQRRATNVQPIDDPADAHGLLVLPLLEENNFRWNPESRCQFLEFIGTCWDAALEYHGGTADDEFLKCWDEGIANVLPTTAVAKANLGSQALNSLAWKLTTILDLITTLEGKCPGLAKLPVIREYLVRHVFQRRSPDLEVFSYKDLEGDSTTWTHLKEIVKPGKPKGRKGCGED